MFATTLELIVVFLFSAFFALYLYYRHCFTYWKKRGAPQLDPCFPVGDLGSSALGTESVYVRLEKLYYKFKNAGHRFGGIYFFNGPIFFPVNPELIKRVLVADFDHFVDRGMYVNEKKVPLSSNMFTMPGEEWKTLRNKLSPTFTSGKMKSMYNILVEVSQNLVKTMNPIAERGEEIELKQWLARYTTDIIGSAAFGVECNSLANPNTEFCQVLARLFKNPSWKLFRLMLEEGLQNPGNINKIFMDKKEVTSYFIDLVRDTVEYRDQNKIVRNDFLNNLMQMRSTSGLEFKDIVAQSFLFFTAGFETSSTVMSFCIHELAHAQEIQDRAREEVREKLGRDSSKYSYEDIWTLPYLDKCVKETMRKYPVVAMLNRECVKDYQVPDSKVVVQKGTPVIIPVLGLHRDPEFFPDPLVFDPERFNNEKDFVGGTYLPFGDGPRNCIGLRFGLMQTKLGLATLLNDFKFLSSSNSPRDLPIEASTTSLVFTVAGGIHTKVVKA